MDEPVGSLLVEFPRERTWLLPALQAVQESEGWLSSEALAAVAEHVRLPLTEAAAIATDYAGFRLVRPGSHSVRVCTGLSCRLTGAADHLRALENRLGIARGQTTSDDRELAHVGSAAIRLELGSRRGSAPATLLELIFRAALSMAS